MSKLTWVCGVSFALALLTGACADDDPTPSGVAGSGGGRAGASGTAGRAGASGDAGSGATGGTAINPGGAGDDGTAGCACDALAGAGPGGANNGGGAEQAGAAGEGEGGAPSSVTNCLADGTTLHVTAVGTSAYVIGGLTAPWTDGAGDNNAPLTLCRGFTYTFSIDVTGHPFYIKTSRALSGTDAYDDGVTNNGAQSGNVVFSVPTTAPAGLFYQCAFHTPMGADVTIVDPG